MKRHVMLAAAMVALSLPARAQDAAPGNAANGEKSFTACRACHQVGPTAKNGVGPELNGVVGRPAASVPGYSYSAAMKTSGLTWSVAELQQYLANPQGVVKGTKMAFAGYPHDPQKVNDIIAYLDQVGPDGQPKPH